MADERPVKRQTAHPCSASVIAQGTYVRHEGWEPNFLATPLGALSRVSMAGVIVQQEHSQASLDDGTGTVVLRSFDDDLSSFSVGDTVLVVGRPRVYAEQTYILIEIIRRLGSRAWLKYHAERRELLQRHIPPVPVSEAPSRPAPPALPVQGRAPSAAPSLITVIRELDRGEGAPTDEVLRKAGPGAEEKLRSLIAEGEVFELRAGKVKVLE
ncbi:hypothetical protein JXA12_02870 [Candidatus Woesearchaeota archaeon]|nr:hypothetical protein [Candidatus Woesearchaeota archaeon]